MVNRITCAMTLLTLLAAPVARSQSESPAGPMPSISDAIAGSSHWVDASPLQATLPPQIGKLIRAQDVLSYAAPGVLYPVRNIGLQCQGVNATLADVPHRVALVHTSGGGAEERFGEAVVDGSRVFRLQAGAQDTLPTGISSRCELVSYPMPGSALPQGETFWFAFSFWADDWSGTHDEQLIAQMHVQEPRHILLNPFFALVVRGEELRVELRHNARDVPDQASTQVVTTTRRTMLINQWVTAVVQARISNQADRAPFLRLWLNGEMVTDYLGPLGYVLPPGGYAYPKVGIYHWAADNPWDLKVPTRALLVGAILTVQDATGRYTSDLLKAAIARPAQP